MVVELQPTSYCSVALWIATVFQEYQSHSGSNPPKDPDWKNCAQGTSQKLPQKTFFSATRSRIVGLTRYRLITERLLTARLALPPKIQLSNNIIDSMVFSLTQARKQLDGTKRATNRSDHHREIGAHSSNLAAPKRGCKQYAD